MIRLPAMRLLAVLAALSLPLMADPLADAFARLDKAAAGFKSMKANISQTVHTAIVNDDTTEIGSVKLKRPKPGDTRILMELTKPDQKIVAVQGDQVKIYLPKAKTVQVYDLSNRHNAVQQGLLLGFGATSGEMKASYEISWVGAETLNGQAASHIQLIPRSKEVLQNMKQADLWLSNTGGYPVQQRVLTSGSGDYLQLTYSDVQINPSLSDKDLQLNPPKGVQIQQVGK
jgi:outer membrane lipoprotein-sorting protein